MLLLYLFCLGLIIGSFLNVVVLRGEKGESLGGRSHCPECRTRIHWYDNIPVFSYCLLRGTCRHCQTHISWQYPLVEFFTGLLFAGTGYMFFSDAILVRGGIFFLIAYLVLVSFLFTILITDIRTMEIPLSLLVGGVGVALSIVFLRSFFPAAEPWQDLQSSVSGALLGGGGAALFFYAMVFFSKETWMGMGDVWLSGLVGLMVGIQLLLFTLTLSFLLGAVVGLILLGFTKKGMKSHVPFAPFLVVALWLVWILLWINPLWLSLFVFSFN